MFTGNGCLRCTEIFSVGFYAPYLVAMYITLGPNCKVLSALCLSFLLFISRRGPQDSSVSVVTNYGLVCWGIFCTAPKPAFAPNPSRTEFLQGVFSSGLKRPECEPSRQSSSNADPIKTVCSYLHSPVRIRDMMFNYAQVQLYFPLTCCSRPVAYQTQLAAQSA